MAIANSTQILVDTNKKVIIKRVGIIDSDENETIFIDPLTLSGVLNANGQPYQTGNTVASGFANTSLTVSRVIASVDAEVGHLQLKWEGTGGGSKTIVAYGVGYHDSNPQYQLSSIPNNATNATGNITIKTVGTTANAAYTILIELHKNGTYYSAGQFTDPAAFNYPPYGVTP